jgi:hypothetical protein
VIAVLAERLIVVLFPVRDSAVIDSHRLHEPTSR